MPTFGHKNVRRLDVAVYDASGMGGIQRVCDVDTQRENQLGLHGTSGNVMFQRQAVEKLHGDEHFAVLVVNFVDGTNVRVVQCGGGLGFALEAAERLRVFGYVVRQEFERDKAIEFDVLSLKNNAHATTAKLVHDVIMGNGPPDLGITGFLRV